MPFISHNDLQIQVGDTCFLNEDFESSVGRFLKDSKVIITEIMEISTIEPRYKFKFKAYAAEDSESESCKKDLFRKDFSEIVDPQWKKERGEEDEPEEEGG